MTRLAIAAGSYADAQLIAARLRLGHGGWRFVADRSVVPSLRSFLVLVNQESLLEHHDDGDVILDQLLDLAEKGALVFATVDPTLFLPTSHASPNLPLTR